jgi:hypothetical protein
LIRSIGERNMSEGVDALMKTAKDPEAEVRIESLKTLKAVAGSQYLSQLLDLLMAARTDAERREAEDTVAAVVRKSDEEDERAKHVLTITTTLPSVKDVTAKSSLLNVLGKIGHDSALPVLRASVKDSDIEVKGAAVRVLSEWPTGKPADALLAIARTSDDQRQRILALRGYIRMIGLGSERPAAETVKMYALAMQLASEVGEKRTVLSGLANVKSLEALQLAADYLADSALQKEAEAAVVRIAQNTRAEHPGQTKAVLQKVVEISKNEGLRQQAQRLIDEIK